MLSKWLFTANLLLMATISTSALYLNYIMENDTWEEDKRLPTGIIPTSYRVALKPDLDLGKFTGSVEINIKCKENTNIIVLQAHNTLHIDTNLIILTPTWSNLSSMTDTMGQMMFSNSSHPNIASIKRNPTTDELIITTVEQMHIGDSYKLYIQFSGKIQFFNLKENYNNDYFCGMISGKYDTKSNSPFIMTSMLINCTRRVFPCFDEPSFKSRFQISVARPRNMTTVSVMPVDYSEEIQGDWMWDHFKISPPISTFSISIFTSELEKGKTIYIKTNRGKYTVQYFYNKYADKKIRNDTRFPFSKTIQFLEGYLGITFPVPKLDIVIIPSFIYNEMNTLGTILQNEYMSLIPSLIDQWVLHTITPKWWNNLNITNILGLYLTKITTINVTAKSSWYEMENDQTYSILSEPDQSTYMYKYFNVFKGEWFLQMLRESISEHTLKKGLFNLLIKNKYNTFDEAMLWDSLTEQAWKDRTLPADISVQTLANSWLHKPVFPIVTVKRNYGENSAVIHQHVFMRNYNSIARQYYEPKEHEWTEEEKQMKWWIPVLYLTPHNIKKSNNLLTRNWIREQQRVHITNLPNYNEFVIFNPTDSGMFLVNYDQQNWHLITETLITRNIMLPTVTRKKVLQDAAMLTANGNLNYNIFLNMSLFLFNETELEVWNTFTNAMIIDWLETFSWTSVEQKLSQYLRKLVTPFFETLKEPSDEDYDTQDIRSIMAYYNCRQLMLRIGYQQYINKTQETVKSKLITYPFEDTQTRLIIFCPKFLNKRKGTDLLAHAEKLDTYAKDLEYGYDTFWKRSLSECPGYSNFIHRILNEILYGKRAYEDNEWEVVMNLVASNPTAHNLSLKFFVKSFDQLKRSLSIEHMQEFLKKIISLVKSEEQLKMLLDFYREHEHDPGQLHDTFTTSIKDAYKIVEWNKEHLSPISHWFDDILPNI